MSGDIQTTNPQQSVTTQQTAGVTLSTTDISGTPGSGTVNTPRGKCAMALGASTLTITSNVVKTTSTILVTANQAAPDTTALSFAAVCSVNGSFTITANANATANCLLNFVVFP
jgi:hypothetical protein